MKFYDTVKHLIINCATINKKNKDGNTPLHFACQVGSSFIVLELMAKGANLNQQNKDGDTPLHIAIKKGYCILAQSLLKAGATILQKKSKW